MKPTPLRRVGALLVLAAALVALSRLAPETTRPATGTPTPKSRNAAPVAALATPASPIDPAICAPTGAVPGPTFAGSLAARAQREEALARTAAFTHWLTDWRRAASEAQPALAARGRELAVARRSALKHLIETDPRRALELAVPVGLRGELPAEVRAQLETRVDHRGAFEVSISHAGAEARVERVAVIAGESYRTYVFGRRENQPTKSGLPLHGIALDGVLALDETPYRALDDIEKADHGLASGTAAVWVGEELAVVPDAGALTQLTDRLVAAESQLGPAVPSLMSASPGGSATPDMAAVTSPPSWINGTKRALFLKIDFSDDTGAAFTDAEIQAGGAATADYYTATGQTKTTFVFSIIPTVLRMPKPNRPCSKAKNCCATTWRYWRSKGLSKSCAKKSTLLCTPIC